MKKKTNKNDEKLVEIKIDKVVKQKTGLFAVGWLACAFLSRTK